MKKTSYTYYTILTNGAGYVTPITMYAETEAEARQIYIDNACCSTPIKHWIRNPHKIEKIKALIEEQNAESREVYNADMI